MWLDWGKKREKMNVKVVNEGLTVQSRREVLNIVGVNSNGEDTSKK